MSRTAVLAFAFICGFPVTVGLIMISLAGSGDNYKADFDLGKESYQVGISAEANPHQGRSSERSIMWLRGWIEAKKEATQPGDTAK